MDKQKNIPQLRFPEFEGEWQEKRLEELFCEFKSGFGITSKRISESGNFPVFGGNGLRGFTDSFTHDGFYLLIGRQGALCGNVNRSYGKAYISEHAVACKANDSSDTEWLAQRLDFYNLNRLSESSAQPGLSVNKLLRFKLIVPICSEQQKIASFFTAIDKKISQLKRKKTLLEQYKKGVMQKIFLQEIRFKDDNGQEFPMWEKMRLGSFLVQKIREVLKPDKNYLAIGVRSHCKGTFQRVDSDPDKIEMDSLFVVKKDDLVVNITFAWEGAIAIAKAEDDGGLVSHRFPTYVFDEEKVLGMYFQYVFIQKKFRELLELISPGGAGRNRVLNKKDFLKLTCDAPNIEEQTKIANFLSAIDEKINHIQKQIEKAEVWKKGLMQQMFV